MFLWKAGQHRNLFRFNHIEQTDQLAGALFQRFSTARGVLALAGASSCRHRNSLASAASEEELPDELYRAVACFVSQQAEIAVGLAVRPNA